VNDDSDYEPDETVIVTMGSPTNATKGGTDEHTATITNNDAAAPEYNEAYSEFSADSAGSWVDEDLSGLSVPANAVVEIAIRNADADLERLGGVRANGSSLSRYVNLQEAERGGWDVVTMFVEADVDSTIECYAQDTTDIKFKVLGWWTTADYQERMDGALSAGANASWEDEDLSGYGVSSGDICEMLMYNTNGGYEREAGVRTNGSALARKVDLHEPENGGVDAATMLVEADGDSKIDVYAEVDGDVTFYLLGYFSTAPGAYTEAFASVGKPASDNTWGDRDLTSDGVPDDAICEILMCNGATGYENYMGVRENDSSVARYFDLHESEGDGRDCGRMHVTADSTATIEQYMEDVSDTAEFILLGYWE